MTLALTLITTVCAITTALCARYGPRKVGRTTRYVIFRFARSRKVNRFFLVAIGTFFVIGLLLSFLVGLMSFMDSLSIVRSFAWFALMFSAVVGFSYTNYRLAQ